MRTHRASGRKPRTSPRRRAEPASSSRCGGRCWNAMRARRPTAPGG
ncbi:Hypothetical protein I596_2409 [Dokdonella koreensis DS-123]|uniref:Uncharacterized protein n=1 Tax=Dokdonella koreensis DS-123 TaxID=1300342 RepID=A0A160DV65_9GAMM|nr:Hypothetical protein I596_2409 [Dokdonella koreensis DS-123]